MRSWKHLKLTILRQIADLPHGKHAIGCKWLYTTKYNPKTEKIERHKSRLVALGNRQREGIDYKETFAPVAKMSTMRSLLDVATMNGWNVHQMDVKKCISSWRIERNSLYEASSRVPWQRFQIWAEF